MLLARQTPVNLVKTGLNLLSQAVSIDDSKLKLIHANCRT